MNSDDWQQYKSVTECNRHMLETGLESDVTFLVGHGKFKQRFYAHKYVLISRNPVFFTMLCGNIAEDLNRAIEITDIEPDAFRVVLNYLYCDDRSFPDNLLYLVAYAADKYDIQVLQQKCSERMTVTLDNRNVFDTLQFATTHCNDKIINVCIEYIYKHTKELFDSKLFLSLSCECIQKIISVHRLNLNEIEVFEYVMKWAHMECQRQNIENANGKRIRSILGEECVGRIDFFQMPKDYFLQTVLGTYKGLLTESKARHILKFLESSKVLQPRSDCPKRLIVNRFSKTQTGKGYTHMNEDALYFCISEDVILQTVYIFGSCQNPGVYKGNIRVEDENNSIIAIRQNFIIETDGHTKEFPVSMDSPFLLDPDRVQLVLQKDKQYSIILSMSGPASFYGCDGKPTMTVEGTMIQFSTNYQGLNGTNVERGQFSAFVFEKFNR